MAYTLYAHQKDIIARLTNEDRFLLLAEVGTGKTLPMLVHLSNLLIAGEVTDCLIVAPLSGLDAWRRDIEKFPEDRRRGLVKAIKMINWDKLSRKDSRYQTECWHEWGMVILDEGHAIANPSSNRTQYFVGKGKALGLASKAAYFYELTGTLINNSRLEDLWAPLRAILGDDYYTWKEFKAHHLVTKPLPGTYAEIVIGYRNRAELLDLVARYSYRVLKKDCLDLPAVQPDEIIHVPWLEGRNGSPFNKPTEALYADALDSYVEALDKVADNPLSRLMLMRQIATGHVKESDTRDERGRKVKGQVYPLKNLKTQYAMELIQANLPHKTVCFHNFVHTGRALDAALTKAGIKHVTLNGAQKDKDIWRRFQEDDTIKVIVVQYESGSSAIDLFAASYTLYLEPTDSALTLEQSRARTDRNGQTESCEYVFLLTEGSVEVDMHKRLAGHQDFAEESYREIARDQARARGDRA